MGNHRVYKVLGTSDDHTACELCGRDDLKSTVALEDVETGQTVYYGSDCAARAANWTIREVKCAAAEVDRLRRQEEHRARVREASKRTNEWQDWLQAKTGCRDIFPACQQLGGFRRAREIYAHTRLDGDATPEEFEKARRMES